MSVVHQDSPNKYSPVENVVTAKGARTMAIDTKTHMAHLAEAEYAAAAPAEPGKKSQTRNHGPPQHRDHGFRSLTYYK